METTTAKCNAAASQTKAKQRHSKKITNLEKEVELILSQDESDEEKCVEEDAQPLSPVQVTSKRKTRASVRQSNKNNKKKSNNNNKHTDVTLDTVPTTPNSQKMSTTSELPKTLSACKITALAQMTPRRSARKSMRPMLDYDDIVEKRKLHSAKKIFDTSAIDEEMENNKIVEHETASKKWSIAEVGRSSQSRNRKSHRGVAKKRKLQEKYLTDENVAVEDATTDENVVINEATTEEKGADKDASIDENVAINEATTEEKGADKDASFDENVVINEDTTEEKGAGKDASIDENVAVNNATADENIAGKDCTDDITTEKRAAFQNEIERDEVHNEICIIASNKVSKQNSISQQNDDKDDILVINDLESEEEDNFGAYLKSKPIDISDLGLKPLWDTNNDKKEDVEMPSLVFDEKSEDKLIKKEVKEENITNTTFDYDEKVEKELNVTFEKELEDQEKNKVVEPEHGMPTLQISDDEDEEEPIAVKEQLVKFMLTDTDENNTTLLNCNVVSQPNTPKAMRPKAYRFPTPYKQKANFNFSETMHNQNKMTSETAKIYITNLEPKEIVLRSIRKRSKSASIDPERAAKNVYFYSPANQTVDIETFDKIVAKTVEKNNRRNDTHVTKRRKRSISLDDVSFKKSKLPKPKIFVPTAAKTNTPGKDRQQTTIKAPTRTKLPNFAAIHQKRFDQMENLVQHVERKAERALLLTNSATKLVLSSAQKKEKLGASKDKLKASKKIELQPSNVKPKVAAKEIGENTEFDDLFTSRLPKPRQFIATVNKTASNTKAVTTERKQRPLQAANSRVPASHEKPAFNLFASVSTSSNNKLSKYEEKSAARRQRHMNMYKGRTTDKRENSVPKEEYVRGIRTNRRFQLQMEHRKNTTGGST